MKWPEMLVFIRHGESEFNRLRDEKKKNQDFVKFRELFDKEFGVAEDANWPSAKLKKLAEKVAKNIRLGVSDYNTPLTKEGVNQALKTGLVLVLKEKIPLPDVIYVSPYRRTVETLNALKKGWPELSKVKTIHEERIREQEHGLQTVYNDWRIYYALNPIQGLLFKLEGEYEYRFLNGENRADVRERVRSFLGTLIREDAGKKVLVISHHLTLLSFRANLERWGRDKFIDADKNEKPINCGMTIYRGKPELGHNGKLILESYNQKYY
jgi:broad specificity phosphatase PhoE